MRLARPHGLLLLVLLIPALDLAIGCDALSGGSKDKDETSEDEDSSKKKKKKKKKKDDEDEEDGEDGKSKDEDDKDDKTTPSVPPPPPPAPPPTSGLSKSCQQVIDGYECMKVKLGPSSASSIDQSIQQMKQMFQQLGPAQAEETCVAMLKPLQDSLAKIGCGGGVTPSPTPGPVPPSPTPSPSPSPTPGTRSAVPTLEEWAQVTTEVTVHGSSKLNCETKMLREWLRVSCRGKNHTGGTPTTVSIIKGGNAGVDDFVLSGTGVTSLVIRWVEGVDVDASFSWTDRTHVLHVFWPRQSPEPPYKGKFDPLP